MATQLKNSKAEDNFAELLESKYGLVEGWLDDSGMVRDGHYVREHWLPRSFTDVDGNTFRSRVDFWFPQWRIVVEFKAAPLGRKSDNKRWADGYTNTLKAKGRPKFEWLKHDWSNQWSKFQAIVQQAARPEPVNVWQPAPISEWTQITPEPEPRTADILWILADDGQVSTAPKNMKRYTYKGVHQVNELRKTHAKGNGFGWNPMSRRECGRLLYMYKEASELSAVRIYGQAYYDSLSVMEQVGLNVQIENTKRMILPELHTLDTTEGLHLVLDYEVVPPEGTCCEEPQAAGSLSPCGTCGAAGGGSRTEVVDMCTVPLIVAPQK